MTHYGEYGILSKCAVNCFHLVLFRLFLIDRLKAKVEAQEQQLNASNPMVFQQVRESSPAEVTEMFLMAVFRIKLWVDLRQTP